MDLGIAGKVALVAGGSRGCSRGISDVLAMEGARVVLTGRQEKSVGEAVEAIGATGGTVHGIVADMTSKDGVDTILAETRKTYGDPDIPIVNAPAPFPSESGKLRGFANCLDEDYVNFFEAFVLSQVRLTRAVLPAMKAKNWGRLLNIGSIAFKVPHQEDPVPANDVRIAVVPLMRILSQEYGPYGVTANTIATGPFDSELVAPIRPRSPRSRHRNGTRKCCRLDDGVSRSKWGGSRPSSVRARPISPEK
jgi:3-oxoacyl-[acyl-carrier protein] reductase